MEALHGWQTTQTKIAHTFCNIATFHITNLYMNSSDMVYGANYVGVSLLYLCQKILFELNKVHTQCAQD